MGEVIYSMDDRTLPFRAIEVQVGSSDYTVAPGTSLAVPFALANHSGYEDSFEIHIQGVPDDWVFLDMPVIHLAPNERREASVTFRAPEASPLSEGVYPVILRAVSQSHAEWRDEASFNLTVGSIEATRPSASPLQIPFSEVPGQPYQNNLMGVIIERAQYSVAPGQTLSIPVTIANRGMLEDTFYLSVDGLPQDWVSLSVSSLHLYPSDQRLVTLAITPPGLPSSRAGRYPFRLRVFNQAGAGQGMEVNLTLTVTAISQFVVDVNPRRIDSGKTARLRIQNLGNIQETYQIHFESQDGSLEFIPSISGPITVAPGETAAIDFNVSRRGLHWFGTETIIPYTIIVRSAEGEGQTLSAEVSSRPVFPIWVIPVLLFFLLTVICGVGFLLNWNQKRMTGATQTAEALAALHNDQTATATVLQPTPSMTPGLTNTPALPSPSPSAMLTDTPLPPTLTPTAAATMTETPAPTIPPPTDTPAPPAPTATNPPAATATFAPLPVSGQQLILWAASQSGGNPVLFLMNTADRSIKALTPGDSTNTQPAWSPDGSKIAFTSHRDGNNEIYVMAPDGSNPVNLTRNPGDDSYPAWSPDSARILFTSNRDGNNEIYEMNADGSNPVNLTKSPANDFKAVWYTQNNLLTSTSRILFTSDRSGHNQIYAMNTDGANPVNLSNNNANDSLPDVPIKGGKVAFVSDRDGNLEIYVMGLDGSDPANLTQNPAADTQPAWSPDGKWMAFISNRSGVNQAYLMAGDGKQVTILAENGQDTQFPAWH